MALNGKTPAEASGIDVNLGQSRWKSLIAQSDKAAETQGFIQFTEPSKQNILTSYTLFDDSNIVL